MFLHLLPELHEGQRVLHDGAGLTIGSSQSEIYLVALVGLVAFLPEHRKSNFRAFLAGAAAYGALLIAL